jgi:hypothetical protein
MRTTLFLFVWLIALVSVTRAINLTAIAYSPSLTYTRLDFTFDGAFEFKQEVSSGGGLKFLVSNVDADDAVVLPDISADKLIKGVTWQVDSQGLELTFATTIFADRFEAYRIINPDRLVIKIYRRLVDFEQYGAEEKRLSAIRAMKIYLVDDDDGINNGNLLGGVDYDQIYQQIFADQTISADTIHVRHKSLGPDYQKLKEYNCVIWFTGIDAIPCLLPAEDQNNLIKYLEGGGKLLLVSQNLLSERSGGSEKDLVAKMGIGQIAKDTQQTKIAGVSGSFAEGMSLNLNYEFRCGGNWGDGFKISPNSNNEPILVGEDGWFYGLCGGLGEGKVVFISVAFENADMPSDREELLLRALYWLATN